MRVLEPQPALMTNRARVFLMGTAVLFLALANFLVFCPDTWTSPSYASIKALPLWWWGAIMAAAACALISSAITRNARVARITLSASAVITGLWTAGFVSAWIIGTLAGPSGPLAWAFTTFVLLLQVWQPMRVPLEEVVAKASREWMRSKGASR